jgi:nucleotide-binding universal stress UspA family protein
VAIAYIIQVQSAAWYVKYSEKLFGPPSKEPVLAPEKAEVPKAAAPAGVCEAEGIPSFKKILYATDLSETARHAVKYACTIGEKYGATVTVLHVVPNVLDEFSMDTGIDLADHVDEKTLKEFNEQGVTRAKERIRERIEEASQAVTREIPCCPLNKEDIRVEVGNPADRIVSVAETENYDLVIMGTHGLGKWEEAIVGTVAGGVIRKCRKPVLVVKLPG